MPEASSIQNARTAGRPALHCEMAEDDFFLSLGFFFEGGEPGVGPMFLGIKDRNLLAEGTFNLQSSTNHEDLPAHGGEFSIVFVNLCVK